MIYVVPTAKRSSSIQTLSLSLTRSLLKYWWVLSYGWVPLSSTYSFLCSIWFWKENHKIGLDDKKIGETTFALKNLVSFTIIFYQYGYICYRPNILRCRITCSLDPRLIFVSWCDRIAIYTRWWGLLIFYQFKRI